MKTKLSVASVGCGVLLALTACGGGDDGGEEREAWAREICAQLQPQVERIQSASAAITEVSEGDAPPREIKETDSTAFQEISEAYGALATVVQRAGDPPVENGPALRRDAVEELNGISDSYAELKDTMDGLETSDRAAFAEGLSGIAEQLGDLSESGNDALTALEEGELGEAMAEQRGCQSPPAQPGGGDSGNGGDDGGDGGDSGPDPEAEPSGNGGGDGDSGGDGNGDGQE
ncbi:small secreted protein [Streptomyces sp. 4N509B]|uniref:small secreted protein n=1 Tax=Streptomyces sp. 4N509B TaxID=3457413 RepID=UPI003FD0C578